MAVPVLEGPLGTLSRARLYLDGSQRPPPTGPASSPWYLAGRDTCLEPPPQSPPCSLQTPAATHFRQLIVLIVHDQNIVLQFLDLGLGRDLLEL